MTAEKKPAAPGSTAGHQQQHQTTTPDAGAIVAGQPDGGKLKLSPRQARVIRALMPGAWITREALDRIAGASNAPDVIMKLRGKLGHDAIDTERIDGTDRDGRPCRTGRYRMTEPGRVRAAELLGKVASQHGEARA